MADSGDRRYQKLPPGWDCKYDQETGNCYYINYITKAMQLHDPRYRLLQNERCSSESIAMQSLHGSGGSPYHVYPSNNMPVIRAFQTQNSSLQYMSTSPLLPSSRTHLINDMSPLPAQKYQIPQAPRTVNLSRRSTIQETSFSNQIDTDAVVKKIQNMFPTASENHIRLLLKNALQVEKHPVTMPGPHVTPPGQRHLFHSNSSIHMTPPVRRFDTGSHLRGLEMGNSYSRTASPVPQGRLGSAMSVNSGNIVPLVLPPFHGSPCLGEHVRNSPKPHSSPKMKLRYMKMIFPKADETLLLDVLANADNNVQKASEKIISLGYTKKEFVPNQKSIQNPVDQSGFDEQNRATQAVTTIPLRPKEYTEDEKLAIKERLQGTYPHIVEYVILMALESVNYVEDRARQILQIVHDEEQERAMSQIYSSRGLTELDNVSAPKADVRDGTCLSHVSSRSKKSDLKDKTAGISSTTKDALGTEVTNAAASRENDDNLILSLNLNLSAVTMEKKSILDRYRLSFNTSSSHYIRGTCASTKFWDKLSPQSRDKSDSLKNSHRECINPSEDKLCKEFKSLMGRIQTNGPNSSLAKGADEGLLLADYVTWNGANPEFYKGQGNLATGPDISLRSEPLYKPYGPNPDLCKGPKATLAKGSIYNQQNASSSKTINIKCN
ncbi:uncharacterized protein LOC131807023 isoform X2 [Musca domestica]|uniref:Uncharacterized protein LOC131807023 isoform X2 n=1 Tax=Musca domestica TaxID=7370 RepID=A0ABM3VQU9_MUSDO|nr:uncharacterized protein LOC131807023 isoform X2 [Musca domestica]